MSTLAETEAAAANLSPGEKEALPLFLAESIRSQRSEPASISPRTFEEAEVLEWVAEDEADQRRLRDGK